jgi:hypothetical protein
MATSNVETIQETSLNINGGSQDGPAMSILIHNYKLTTSFFLNDLAYVNIETTAGNSYFCVGGQLVISSLTQTHISGTFSGTVVKSGDSTNQAIPMSGTFDADIPQ